MQYNPDFYFDPKTTSTPELKRKYLAHKISNFEDKTIILVLNGNPIMNDYESCSLMFEQISLDTRCVEATTRTIEMTF